MKSVKIRCPVTIKIRIISLATALVVLLHSAAGASTLADLSADSTNPNPEKAATALFLLGNNGVAARPYRPAMGIGLMRYAPAVRQAAARALKLSGPGAGFAIYPQVAASSNYARLNAVHGFSLMNEEGVGPLRRLLTEDPEAAVRESAARMLGKMGDEALSAVSDLRLAIEDPDVLVRVAAKGALDILSCAQPLLPSLSQSNCYGRATSQY